MAGGSVLGKTALIVDDSRSARVVLKQMLETHELDVDTAESAEDALDYLNEQRPDVIFMDHLMPGMDGFEAVSAIKNNPATATIPSMMYTSQEGEVYVGQARALGAVGVLPKQVEPVELSKVLESLRVIGSAQQVEMLERDEAAAETSGEYPVLETLDQDLRFLIKDLFDQQRAVLRRDLLDSYETIASRVVDEIRPPDPQEPEEPEDPVESPTLPVNQIAVAILALMTMVFAALYWQREQSWRDLQIRHTDLQQTLDGQRAGEAEDSLAFNRQIDAFEGSLAAMYGATISAVEWAANRASAYGFDELPMGDSRLDVIEQVSTRLSAIDFSGIVRVETHNADFCMVVSGADGYRLP
jgi:CheY-like chemotaxis protein